jgi:hypothetical protein
MYGVTFLKTTQFFKLLPISRSMGRSLLLCTLCFLACLAIAASSVSDRPATLNCSFSGFVRFGSKPDDKAFSEIKSQEHETTSFTLTNLDKKEVKLKESETGVELTLKESFENPEGTFLYASYGMAYRLYVINWKVKKVYVYSIVNFGDGFSTSLISASQCK